MVATRPDRVVVIGGPTADVPANRFGAADAPWGSRPLGVLIADWLLTTAGWTGPSGQFVVAGTGAAAVDTDDPAQTALVVLADLSAAINDASPRPRNEASVAMSVTIADAVASADVPTLANLDADKAAYLDIEGAPSLRYLAAAAGTGEYDTSVEFRGAPFGVDYIVAAWRRRR